MRRVVKGEGEIRGLHGVRDGVEVRKIPCCVGEGVSSDEGLRVGEAGGC